MLYEELIKQEKHKEAMVILQCFRYFVKNDIVWNQLINYL